MIKLSAILSLVFARLFGQAGWLVCVLHEGKPGECDAKWFWQDLFVIIR